MSAALLRNDHGNAFNALAERARRTPSAILVFIETASLLFGLAIYAWAPTQWRLTLPCVALGLLGVWGVIDHQIARLHRRAPKRRFLRVAQSVVAAAGITAAVAGAWFLLGGLLGSFIS